MLLKLGIFIRLKFDLLVIYDGLSITKARLKKVQSVALLLIAKQIRGVHTHAARELLKNFHHKKLIEYFRIFF